MNRPQNLPTAYANPIPIQYRAQDQIIHTPFHPFCLDLSCGCHKDLELLEEQAEYIDAGLLTVLEFIRTINGKQI